MPKTAGRVAYRWLKRAMSRSDALKTLGFPATADPDPAAVNRAYRDILKKDRGVHPDQGGSTETMVALNVAKDILTGQMPPDRNDFGTSSPNGPSQKHPTPEEPKEIKQPFSAEATKVPNDVEWFFVTTPHYSGYSSNEFENSNTGWVACGQTKDHWIFVAVEHHYYRAYGPGAYFSLNVPQAPKDIWNINVIKKSKRDAIPTAEELYDGVVMAWKNFEYVEKKFNSKVTSAKGWTFKERAPGGRIVTIKQLIANELGVEFTGKTTVEVGYKEPPFSETTLPSGYYKPSQYSSGYQLQLTINGRDHILSVADMERLAALKIGGKRFVARVFGDYPQHSRPKSLTRNRDGKVIMGWMAEKLPHLPDWVREALQKAAA